LMMPLTYSIANGIGLGFIIYVLAKAVAGRYREVNVPIATLAMVFALKFALPG
jgi:adenine/guanine/hypoxanthine permease